MADISVAFGGIDGGASPYSTGHFSERITANNTTLTVNQATATSSMLNRREPAAAWWPGWELWLYHYNDPTIPYKPVFYRHGYTDSNGGTGTHRHHIGGGFVNTGATPINRVVYPTGNVVNNQFYRVYGIN